MLASGCRRLGLGGDTPHPRSLVLFWIALLSCCAGCSGLGLRMGGQSREVRAQDGFALRTFRFAEPDVADGAERARVFYFQGSRARSVVDHLGALAGFAAMEMAIIAAELRGVSGKEDVDAATFRQNADKQTRVADGHALLDAYLGSGRSSTTVIVVGASEGGDVAAAIAAADRRVTQVMLFGTGGGWSQADELRWLVRTQRGGLGVTEPELDAAFAAIRAEPRGDALWLGHSYRRWASYLWWPPLDDLRRVDVPILAIHGTADASVPVESARALRDDFVRRGKTNLRYLEYPLDHTFRDAGGRSGIPLLERDAIRWLSEVGVLRTDEVDELDERVVENHPEWFGP